jgi:hypothetical protein
MAVRQHRVDLAVDHEEERQRLAADDHLSLAKLARQGQRLRGYGAVGQVAPSYMGQFGFLVANWMIFSMSSS